MNWIFASLLMFFSSVAMYLMVRKSSLSGNSTQINNLAMFFIPFLIYLPLGIFQEISFSINPLQLGTITLTAILFSYLGNVFSLKGMSLAPNPGYSLVLSKSYVLFTTLVAVVIFNAILSPAKLIAIILIVVFSILIMASNRTTKKDSNILWLPYSFGAFFCWGMLSLVSKYLFNQGVNVFTFLSYISLIVSICILGEMLFKKANFKAVKTHPFLLLGIGLFSTTFNLFLFEAIKTAPNIGYVNATNAASISLITVLAAFFFKDELTLKKIIGVIGVTVGLILLLI